MANKHRGEVDFHLAGNTYAIAPSFKIVADVESAVGGIVPFLSRVQRGDFRVTEVVQVVQLCIRSHPKAPKFGAIPDLVMAEEDGPLAFVGPIAELLSNAISGGQKAKAGEDDEGNGAAA